MAGGRALTYLRWAALLLLALLAVGWRLSALQHSFRHPDEPIALAVVDKVIEEGTLDTNWARAQVPDHFRYNQYNFSAYYLFAAGLERLASAFDGALATDDGARRKRLRTYSVLLAGISVFLAGWLGFRLRDTTTGLTGALLTLVSVPLFQDAIYARPEAFCTALVLSAVLLTTGKQAWQPARVAMLGLLLGLLVATKITFVLLLPFPVVAMATMCQGPGRIRAIWIYLAAVALGAAAGAPFAVANPAEYIEGIAYLVNQYGNGHGEGPHGLQDGSLIERIGHGFSYLHYAVGLPALAASGVGLAVFARQQPAPESLMVGAVLLTLVYFLQSRAFFERNLSHGLPVLFVMSGIGVSWLVSRISTRPWTRAAATIALISALLLPAYSVTRKLTETALPNLNGDEDQAARARLRREGFFLIDARGKNRIPSLLQGKRCGRFAFRVVDFGDRYFKRRLDRMLGKQGLYVADRIKGPFHGAPPSTLHTYHGADTLYLASIRRSEQCAYEFVALPEGDDVTAIATTVRLGGAAARDAYHPGARLDGWRAPLYATWAGNDANTGKISLETREYCAPLLLPFIYGPKPQGVRIEITRIDKDGTELKLHSGVLPLQPDHWAALLLDPRGTACPRYRITMRDNGTGWGQWGGLGQPVSAPYPTDQKQDTR